MPPTTSRLGLTAFAAILLSIATTPMAAPTATTVALAPHGHALRQSGGEPMVLSPTVALIPVTGATHPDDVLLVVTGLDDPATATKTPLSAPRRDSSGGLMARLSATRAVARGPGEDGDFNTGDETLLLIDRIGTSNVVTPIVVGNLTSNPDESPSRLSANSVVMAGRGPDKQRYTADDELILITDLGGTNTVTKLSAPNLRGNRRSQPTVLSPTSCLVSSVGPDGARSTGDEVTYLFTDLGTLNTRTPLATPRPMSTAPGRAVRLSATRAILGAQPDPSDSGLTDGGLFLLDQLGTANFVTPIVARHIAQNGGGRPRMLDENTVIVAGMGADGTGSGADDEFHVVTNLGTTNDVTTIPHGGIDSDEAAWPQRLSPDRVAFCSGGEDFDTETGDDVVTVVSGVGTTNTVTTVPVSGVAEAASGRITPLSSTSLLVADGGADFEFGSGLDDGMTLVTAIPAAPVVERVAVSGEYDSQESRPSVPLALGAGRAISLSSGPDGRFGSGNDDVLNVFGGIPVGRALQTNRVKLAFRANKPTKPTKLLAKGTLALDGLPFGEDDVTISIGNFAQTIAADAFTVNKKGVVKYVDKRAEQGAITRVVYNPKSERLTVKAKGLAIGAETTTAAYVVFAVESADWYLADAGAGKQKKSAIVWKP